MLNRREMLTQAAVLTTAWQVGANLSAADDKQKTPIKFGQIGVGHAHASKLSVFRKSADYEFVGIVEDDPQLRQQAESQAPYSDTKWMTREQLLNVPGLQLVLVETRVKDLLDAVGAA